MKTNHPKLALWPVLAASLIAAPLFAQSPERPDGPSRPDGPPAARQEAANPERIRHIVREMAELHKAGKHDEARKLTQRIREMAKDNPEAARQIFEALREQRQEAAKQDAPKDAPHPERSAARPRTEWVPPGRTGPQTDRPMRDVPRQDPAPAPFARPGALQGPQPMARPGMAQRPDDSVVRGQIAKLRHLKVAAVHLAAAGYPDQAAKAREEAGRIEATLKQGMPQQQRPLLQSRDLRQDRPAFPRPEAAKDRSFKEGKAPGRENEETSPLLRELRKLNKQMADLSNRVRKLEEGADAR